MNTLGRPRQGPGGAAAVLLVVGGNDRGKQHLLTGSTTQIGRGADQDFVLADIAVSRRHVQIVLEGSRYRMRDLGSGNGTLINGVRTATALLNDGDQIEIGNTVLRFDHPSMRATPAAPPMPQAAPQAHTMMAEAPVQPGYGSQATAYVPLEAPMPPRGGTMQAPAPRLSMSMMGAAQPRIATPIAPRAVARPVRGGLLDSPVRKIAVLGSVGFLVVVGGVFVLRKSMAPGGREQAEKVLTEAKRAFAAGDFESAQKLFAQAQQLDPLDPLVPKQRKQSELEIRAKAALKQAQALGAQQRWDEELKLLDTIEPSSAAYDDAQKVRKGAQPEAIRAWLAEARDNLSNDPETARQRLDQVLMIDPDSVEARELGDRLRGAAPSGRSDRGARGAARHDEVARAPREPKPASKTRPGEPEPAGFAAVPARPAPAPAAPAATPAGAKPAPAGAVAAPAATPAGAKPAPAGAAAAPAAGGTAPADVLAVASAAGPYRSKDFSGAAAALRAQKGASAMAQQVAKLADAYGRAEADKGSNPAGAVADYQQAMLIDAQIGKATHAAYFKAQSGKLAKDAAKQAFGQQKFEIAFEMSKLALRFGDDGGIGAQLKAKANEFNGKAAAQAKTNPNNAKNIWRTVLRMVPPGDPAYLAAQKGLSTASGPAKDEDED